MFYKAKIDIQPLLDLWQKSNTQDSLLHFNQLLEDVDFNKHGKPKIRNAFSDDIFNDTVCNWLFSNDVKKKIRKEIEKEIMKSDSSLTESEKESLSWKYEIIK